jgi:hypothetical protein
MLTASALPRAQIVRVTPSASGRLASARLSRTVAAIATGATITSALPIERAIESSLRGHDRVHSDNDHAEHETEASAYRGVCVRHRLDAYARAVRPPESLETRSGPTGTGSRSGSGVAGCSSGSRSGVRSGPGTAGTSIGSTMIVRDGPGSVTSHHPAGGSSARPKRDRRRPPARAPGVRPRRP